MVKVANTVALSQEDIYIECKKIKSIKQLVESKGLIYHGVNYDNDGKKEKKAYIEIICPKYKNKGVQIMRYYNLLNSSGQCLYCIGHGRTLEDLPLEVDNMKSEVTIIGYTSYT